MESSQSSTVRQEEKSRRVLLKGVWVNLEQDRGVSPGDWVEIAQWFELVETLKGHQVQPPCNAQGHPQLHQVVRAPSPVLGGLQGWGTTASGHHECKWNNSLCRNLNPSSVGFGLVAGVGSASPCAAVSSTPSPAPCRAAPCRATAAAAPSPPRAHRPHAGSCRQRGSAAALLFTEMGICMMKITRDGF